MQCSQFTFVCIYPSHFHCMAVVSVILSQTTSHMVLVRLEGNRCVNRKEVFFTQRTSGHIIEWRGEALISAVLDIIEIGFRKYVENAVNISKSIVPIKTGRLYESIQGRLLRPKGLNRQVRWGSYGVHYAIYVEYGTFRQTAKYYLNTAHDQSFYQLDKMIERYIERLSRAGR